MKRTVNFLRFRVPVGLSAFLCAASAHADDPTPRVAPIHTMPAAHTHGSSAATARAEASAGATIPLPDEGTPNYEVEALSFHCNDEVGWDSPWFAPWISDEVIVGIQAPGATTISRVFGDVDSGESRSFERDESCILPIARGGTGDSPFVAGLETWTCEHAGTPGPFSFTVVMAEEDSGFFHQCLSEFPGCTFEPANTFPPGNHDDLIGRRTLEFTAEELAAAMPNVNDTFDETIKLGPCFEPQGCVESPGTPNDAEYTFTYRLTRLPDTLVGPILPDFPAAQFLE